MKEISKQNAKKLGSDTLLWQTQEECGELIKAIGKYNRTRGIGQITETSKSNAYMNMLQEIADVEICIEQLKYLLNEERTIEYFKDIAFEKVNKRYEKEEVKMESSKLGIINEIGDLGLGFEPLSDEDLEKLKEQEKEEK